jgi:hypothetical protein
MIFLISASWVAGITDVSHWCLAHPFILSLNGQMYTAS